MEHENLNTEETANSDLGAVSGSVFAGDCNKNIHWYVGVYSQGQWIYNECSYCKKRQNV